MEWFLCAYMIPSKRSLWIRGPWMESSLGTTRWALFKKIFCLNVALLLYYMYYSLVWCVLFIVYVWFVLSVFSSCFMLGFQMSGSFSFYIDFTNGASHYTQNIASTSWVIFSPMDELLSSVGIYLGLAMTIVVEYSVVIKLLWNPFHLASTIWLLTWTHSSLSRSWTMFTLSETWLFSNNIWGHTSLSIHLITSLIIMSQGNLTHWLIR